MEISKIINEGENTTVEFKELMNDSAYKTISAFANTDGGRLICGVSDDGNINGTDCSDKTMRDIIGKIVGFLQSLNIIILFISSKRSEDLTISNIFIT